MPNQYASSSWNVEPPIGTKIAQDFLIDNFDRVYDKFNDMDSFMFQSVLNGAFGFIKNNHELDKVRFLFILLCCVVELSVALFAKNNSPRVEIEPTTVVFTVRLYAGTPKNNNLIYILYKY